MAVTILIPTPLRPFVGGRDTVEVEGGSVGELLDRLTGWIPEDGSLRVAGGTDEERMRPLDFAPHPDRPARARLADKRGGGETHLTLSSAETLSVDTDEGLVTLNEALQRLAIEMPRLADVVECAGAGRVVGRTDLEHDAGRASGMKAYRHIQFLDCGPQRVPIGFV